MIPMKFILKSFSLLLCCVLLVGCGVGAPQAEIAATTLPVYNFTSTLCEGTGLTVTRLVTESVSCLHDYSLSVSQMRSIEGADMVVLSGAGLEEFMSDALERANTVVDGSQNISLIEGEHHHHEEADADHDAHDHEHDPHTWLDPENARKMAHTICDQLTQQYPQYADTFSSNLVTLDEKFDALEAYADENLQNLSC